MNRDEMRSLAMQLIAQGMDPMDAAMEAAKRAQSAEIAYQQMMQSELQDPTGLYSEGGLSAGGVFGDAPISLTDHDSSARRRAVETRSQMASVEGNAVMRQLLLMQQQMQAQAMQLQAAQENLRLLAASKERAEDPWEHPERGRRKRK